MRGVLPLKVQFGELEHGLLSHHMRWQTELHLNILEYTFRSGRAFIADSNLHFHSNHLALVVFRYQVLRIFKVFIGGLDKRCEGRCDDELLRGLHLFFILVVPDPRQYPLVL